MIAGLRALIRRVCGAVVAWLDRTEPVQCGPLAGNWCPVCGDCICQNPEESLSDWDCPLHNPHSRHAEGGN